MVIKLEVRIIMLNLGRFDAIAIKLGTILTAAYWGCNCRRNGNREHQQRREMFPNGSLYQTWIKRLCWCCVQV